ncbi:MAG: sulfatase [Opitutales bacterium]
MSSTPTNILLITSDQQHWNTLGCINPEVHTPNLDRLAAQGTRFDRAYCPDPTCTPTRASILTGQWPSQHGAWSLGTKLPESAHVVGDDFHAAGYDTGLIGKAHFQPLKGTEQFPSLECYPTLQDLDFWRSYEGPFYGFRHFELARNHTDEGHVGQHYALWMESKGLKDWREHFSQPGGTRAQSQTHKWSIPEQYHYNTWIAERTNARLQHCHDNAKPFFFWASFFDPHPSYLVPEPWDTMYDPATLTVPEAVAGEHDRASPLVQLTQTQNPDFDFLQEAGGSWTHGCSSHLHTKEALAKDIAVYYGMMSCMDKYIGQILDKLDALGLTDNTLVVFTSDHGHYYGHHGLIAKGPFHYEDGVRVPFIARWPKQIAAGQTSNALQSLVDLPVTFLKAAGLKVPYHMAGRDQLPCWTDGEAVRTHTSVEFHHQPTTLNLRTWVDQRYKLTVYYNQPYGELYDLESDPGEINNLWDDPAHAALREELTRKLLFDEMAKCNLHMPRIYGA